jgi:hypothetical protein
VSRAPARLTSVSAPAWLATAADGRRARPDSSSCGGGAHPELVSVSQPLLVAAAGSPGSASRRLPFELGRVQGGSGGEDEIIAAVDQPQAVEIA